MDFEVIVIGGGHAGCEAAHASARLGCKTALVTLDAQRIAVMSCNPAIGGLAKGQLVKEIEALGGLMGEVTDRTGIQFRRLNAGKGPAVRSSRAQCDKYLYAQEMQMRLARVENLTVLEGEVSEIFVEGTRVVGVGFADGRRLGCRSAVITTGTFLRGLLYTGFEKSIGGRVGDGAAAGLSLSLERLGFKLRRLKTGTPPRLSKKSINYEGLIEQPGDTPPLPFSMYEIPEPFPVLPQVSCFITYTNERTHSIIEGNFHRSPMYTGLIEGIGPRYCPSIEDKVKRFRGRERHQIFLEPEGLNTDEVYVNGVSTSLPRDVQDAFIHSVAGLESAEFLRYGYAVEYDAIFPETLDQRLGSESVAGLFFGGQINGTSGYEEAGAQGLVAGLNAARFARGEEGVTFGRDEGYLGVMIDDLISKGTDEPYRMFTSRAEHRLLLREDNADLRLGEKGFRVGLLPERKFRALEEKREKIGQGRASLQGFFLMPEEGVNRWLRERRQRDLLDRVSGEGFLRRPEVRILDLEQFGFSIDGFDAAVLEQIEIDVKYEGYIRREMELLKGVQRRDDLKIPTEIDFDQVSGLSNEIKSRLRGKRPKTIGEMSKMMGMTPAAVANVVIFLKMREMDHE